MPKLILLIGLPGSGKTSLVASMQQTNRSLSVISTDAIRAKLFGNEATQGEWMLVWREVGRQFRHAVYQIQQGQTGFALFDATNAKRSHRKDVIALARSVGFTHLTALWLDVPLALCLWRNQQRDRQVPEEVIHQMHRQLSDAPPSLKEGIECLIQYKRWEWEERWAIEPLQSENRFGNCPNLSHTTEQV
jgi:predicted kinase